MTHVTLFLYFVIMEELLNVAQSPLSPLEPLIKEKWNHKRQNWLQKTKNRLSNRQNNDLLGQKKSRGAKLMNTDQNEYK